MSNGIKEPELVPITGGALPVQDVVVATDAAVIREPVNTETGYKESRLWALPKLFACWPPLREGEVRPVRDDKREISSWVMYDWANHGFELSIASAFGGPFITNLCRLNSDSNGNLPNGIYYSSFYPYCITISVIIQVILFPFLGTMGDIRLGRRKLLIQITSYSGCVIILLFIFCGVQQWWLAGTIFILANVAYGASFIFYNAFLTDMVAHKDTDKISSRGFAYGYAGSSVLLIIQVIAFVFTSKVQDINTDPYYDPASNIKAVYLNQWTNRIVLSSCGIWWAFFNYFAFRYMKARPLEISEDKYVKMNIFKASSVKLWETIKTVKQYPRSVAFLLVFLFYNDGIQGVISLASTFATEDPQLMVSSTVLGLLILLIQIVAVLGALIFAKIANRITTKRAIILSLVIWCFIVTYPQYALKSVPELWFLCVLIGFVLGGSQALSRSLFSRMIPEGLESAFFGFYEISERGTSWMSPLVYGAVVNATHDLRKGLLVIIAFFIIGVVLLPFVNTDKAIEEAKRSYKSYEIKPLTSPMPAVTPSEAFRGYIVSQLS